MGTVKRLLALALVEAMLFSVALPNAAYGAEETRNIQENRLQGYNTDFEGADGAGKLHWWNDANWSGDNIAQKAYGAEEKPADGGGSFYMEVTPDSGGTGVAQIANADIAGILTPGVSYEFSFFAKASDGTKNGKADLQISSVSSNWSSSQAAEITYDNDVTLDENWRLVSGTFVIPAHNQHEQVRVAFVGSAGLRFAVDDFKVGGGSAEEAHGENLVKNPNFADADVSVWERDKGGAAITAVTAGEAVVGDIATYGMISAGRENIDCFAQDVTGVVQSGKTYEYSFWVMLDGDDYKDAPEEQREVSFAPYVVAGGAYTYWGSYSNGILDGNCTQRISAGVWTRFKGTFNPQYTGAADALVIRVIEQGTEYGAGPGVKGRYYLTGVELYEKAGVKKEIETDIPNLKDTMSSADGLGADAYTGVSLTNNELADNLLMGLVEKHFNAVTFGNELKMDALFGYSNQEAPGFDVITWTRADGTVMENYTVPTLNFSLPTTMLEAVKAWNDANPNDFIKIRGHVLTWHSQAPEWFFHEDWDSAKPYVTPDVMDARQEWYIKSVLEHFLGGDSPYKDMFYGWDVVNEAVSDSRGTYRNAEESPNWGRVYGNGNFDYIVNAFRYANRYAPETLELYYNDYNECVPSKVTGITQLLTEVKSHEKDAVLPTRISGMGMQGHHNIGSPAADQIRSAAIAYGNVVGKIQLTELDLKASNDYDGTAATRDAEYTKQAYRYKEIYDLMREVDAMEGIDVNGITIWGVIDGHSWLQTDSGSIGGGSDGYRSQVPLLFDDDYKAKPAFWAFVDSGKLEPSINHVVVMQSLEGADPYAKSQVYALNGADASFQIVWEENRLKVKATVTDNSTDATDGVALYLDWDKARSGSANVAKSVVSRADAQAISGGYVAEFTADRPLKVGDSFTFDVVVTNGDAKAAFNDLRMTQDESSQYFAEAMIKPYLSVSGGAVSVDGEEDAAWNGVEEIPLTIVSGTPSASARAKLLWDETYLYLWMNVRNPALDKSAAEAHERDSVEVFIDENNAKTDSYEADDKQYRIDYENEPSFNGTKCGADNLLSATRRTAEGFIVEAAFKWTDITPKAGMEIGLDMQINDAANGARIGTASWYDESGQGWSSPGVFGTVLLTEPKSEAPVTSTVTVTGGAADKTQCPAGALVTVTATPPQGKKFVKWTSEDGVTFSNDASETATFTMPDKNVSVVAIFEDLAYTVRVTDGSGSGSYKPGDTVQITASAQKNGQNFREWTWTGPDGFQIVNKTSRDASFTMPAGNVTVKANYNSGNGGGCYVATAVYGSYDCPEVWTLRRFRDRVLANTWYGRLFIRLYYAVSPTAVRLFGDCDWFRDFFREKLDVMVADLQRDGFESTPYQDRDW